ncbi:uncharacterized protein N7484_002512 [Penicillium longicatenatum]|uniref:uncharacterized protein n=1 Tax=Penicillium longicatenatum TaxID=1561947 RepID=UPI0025479A53|nr:uncharacterized protein N7484_002512 [Penicillium longicatenatum]KAJ5658863.1 hypothetical protein N7484_002512 [Penicillium longicatenatum]
MPGGGVVLTAPTNVNRIEAPVSFKAYLMCAFAALGASFSVMTLVTSTSLIVSILSAGTFIGALVAGDIANFFGRRTAIIAGCFIFSVGVVLQVASTTYDLLIAGRLIAGLGVGFVSAVIILYMSEIAPRKVRGAMVSGYQFCITVGILLAS